MRDHVSHLLQFSYRGVLSPENILLFGIIPGPNHPSKVQGTAESFLRPLVDVGVSLGTRHIFHCTPTHPNGRSVRAAPIPIVADLPAIRQATGHSAHSSTHMCSFCWLEKKQLNSLDISLWRRKSAKEHRSLAALWSDAKSATERKKLYKESGIRHSEFLRLPY